MEQEYAFEMATSNVRYGAGSSAEVGMDLKDLGCKLVMVLTDPNLASGPVVKPVLDSLEAEGVEYEFYGQVRVEPTDTSFKEAIAAAQAKSFDAFVAIGGGSVIDTAKAANLYSSQPPADFLDYVNAPIGKGLPVKGDLKPLFALPTTAGTGSETTGVAIFDLEEMGAKTGIANRKLKPHFGHHRSQQHPHHAPHGGGLHRPGCFDPCGGILHRHPLHLPAQARTPHPAPHLPGLQPHQRHLVAKSHADHG
jgi:hydroxyacid-oxoacid transhydrogenase